MSDPIISSADAVASASSAEDEVLRQLRSIRFGQVVVQIHGARIVQIERTERLRPEPRPPERG